MVETRRARLNLRRGDNWNVKPGMESFDGQTALFERGWVIEPEDSSLYVGETAWIVASGEPLLEEALWVASGDLEFLDEALGEDHDG